MKKIILCAVLTAVQACLVFGGDAGANFAAKAEEYGKKVEAAENKLAGLELKNNRVTETISLLKQKKEGVLRNVFLQYFLFRGSSLSFKATEAEAELKELKDAYFTYSALVLEQHNKKFMECAAIKCAQAAEIFAQRNAWAGKVMNFKDVFSLDADFTLEPSGGKAAADDIRDYYGKKLIQAEQRLIILKDEADIMAEAEKNGIASGSDKKDEIKKRAAEISEIKTRLETKLRRL
ncbi:MAG TPA: hypothetical protein PLB12_12045 [Candidatus Goldiibacteriota bacterium]|mgnify:CR=1 FL=1|nr:hypothetical protein [Candidatus Goldiibacteriota bacterium]HPN65112.1 hypothetical protein [Candidatus Goldiibacteriota bacterium]HRQ45068.1 hypothetical protein [Candidatus Goldiibacteriota bacterium]